MKLTIDLTEPTFAEHGAELARGAMVGELATLRASLADIEPDQAGIRLHGVDGLRPLLVSDGAIGSVAAGALGPQAFPVRAILFDKTSERNWSLAWHQDRTICVRSKLGVAGFGPWTTKRGMQHVAPPFGLLTRMVTLRVHLDDVAADNAPLLIAPGSHRRGLVPVPAIMDVVQECGSFACLAAAGDVWLYSTPILHASDAALHPGHRRVLQVDYAAEKLPGGLEWLGV